MRFRVYYEDTDSGGVVYYANYLRFCERDRTEFFRARDVSVSEYDRAGILFVVAHVDAAFKAPAHHDDLLDVRSSIVEVRKAGFTFLQEIFRDGEEKPLFVARIRIACVGPGGKPVRLPDAVRGVVEK